jgi:hypothetical protein
MMSRSLSEKTKLSLTEIVVGLLSSGVAALASSALSGLPKMYLSIFTLVGFVILVVLIVIYVSLQKKDTRLDFVGDNLTRRYFAALYRSRLSPETTTQGRWRGKSNR